MIIEEKDSTCSIKGNGTLGTDEDLGTVGFGKGFGSGEGNTIGEGCGKGHGDGYAGVQSRGRGIGKGDIFGTGKG